MAKDTHISWADSTVNLWEGCTKVSPACDHCYAEARNQRFAGGANWGPRAPRRRVSAGWELARRLQRAAAANGGVDPELGRRRRVFVNSLSDFFDNHESIVWRDEAWQLIRECPDVIFMLLTKRPQNIGRMLPADWGAGWDNVWIGTTVENQTEAAKRVLWLLDVPAVLHFVSAEPLLGPLDLTRVDYINPPGMAVFNALMPVIEGQRIGWVIVGGESGGEARPMHPDWVRTLREQCAATGTPFHFKQWGQWKALVPTGGYWPTDTASFCRIDRLGNRADDGWPMQKLGVHAAGRMLDHREHLDFPQDVRTA